MSKKKETKKVTIFDWHHFTFNVGGVHCFIYFDMLRATVIFLSSEEILPKISDCLSFLCENYESVEYVKKIVVEKINF